MQTKVSTKGQVVIPEQLRTRLGIRAGDQLEASIEKGRIVLKPQRKKTFKAKLVKDPLTGHLVIDAGPDAPLLTSEMVKEMLADFP